MTQIIMKFDNCYSILPTIDNNSIDLICIDPPYNIAYTNWDTEQDWGFLFKQYQRILKDTGNLIIFQGWSTVCETIHIGKHFFEFKNWIIWDRIKGRGAQTNFVSTREDILWFIKSANYTFNKIYSDIPKKTKGMGEKNGQINRALSNIWTDISPIVPWSKERVNHPTQKPLSLIERIITIFSNPNNMVLDNFAGSGTTGVACKKLQRHCLLIENNQQYYDIMERRMNEV